jgi:hypothetical protein
LANGRYRPKADALELCFSKVRSGAELPQDARNNLVQRPGHVKWLPQPDGFRVIEHLAFRCHGLQLELFLVDLSSNAAAMNPAEVFVKRESEQETSDIRIRLNGAQRSAQVFELVREAPQMIDDKLPASESQMMRDEKSDYSVEVSRFVGGRRVHRNQVVTIQHHGLVQALRECLGKGRLSNS